MNIWFTGDTHFHHKNIVRGVSGWENAGGQKTRDFKTLEEHDETIIRNINNVVKENDILYHLGDWSFGGIEQIWNFRKRLRCRNIHLILGNHDHHIENDKMLPNCVRNIYGIEDTVQGSTYLSHVNASELFSSVNHLLTKKIGGQSMTLCHYAFRTWDKAHHGTWMLHGHSHGTLPDYNAIVQGSHGYKGQMLFKTMDVGIDTHPEFRPYHFDEIRRIMDKRESLLVDHHNQKTN